MKRLLLGVAGLLLAGMAFAGGPRATREKVEASMVVTGTIGVTPQGTVLAFALDQPEKLPPLVADLIGKAIPGWTFQPVLRDGKPVAAKARMSLRVVAQPIGEGRFKVGVRSAWFGDQGQGIRKESALQPRYPMQAIRGRVEATVYVALRLDRAGRVSDATAEQVNLRVIAGENEMNHWRELFAKATLATARQWTFSPADPSDHALYRDVRVPVTYQLHVGNTPPPSANASYGQWQTYVPGPIEPVPWSDEDKMLSGGVDALPDDGVFGRSSLSLLTPLDHG
ncbi:energy transducer TonB [Frateuria sp. GZRR33]|uniref:energy transducer TonB n=1 Tax=Frateuria sp. GZRR33 TaxID=3351535 RepID=UPI003EDBC391